jgi:hypothetical protein
VSYVVVVVAAWIVLLSLVVLVGRQVARARERRDAAARAAAWVERLGGERRVVFDRRSGLTDRRMGLPDDRPEAVERRRGPPDRRGGGDRRAGPDRRTPVVA